MAAMEIRPRSRMRIVSAKPRSTSPTRCASVTRTSSRVSSAVSLARHPSLSRCLDAVNPGVPWSTTNAVIPRCLDAAGLVRARTTQNPPTDPWVMKVFVPSSTQSSPSRRAVVRRAAESLPLPGSVSAQAASHSPLAALGRYRRFRSSLPKDRTWPVPRPLCEATVSAIDPSTRAISSTQMA